MNILVLGGTGFIGSNLCEQLVQYGHKVRIMDRSMKKTAFINSHFEFVEADFTQVEDYGQLLNGIDIIYHLISTTVPATSNTNPVFDITSNVCSTIKLLQAAVNSKIKKIIFLSSGGTVYGQTDSGLISEEHPTNPICSYGIQKLTIEKYLYYYYHEYGLDYQIVRLGNPYGKRQLGKNGQGVIPIFIRKVQNNEEIQIWGDGSITRDYIYIDDVSNALRLLLDYRGKVKVFNLGSGKGSSLLDIVNSISIGMGVEPVISFMGARSIDVQSNILDISKISQELRWRPTVELNEGIRQMLKKEVFE